MRRKVLRATVTSPKFDEYFSRLTKAADKQSATRIKGLIADTSSMLFGRVKFAVDTLAPFMSAIKEVRTAACMQQCVHICVDADDPCCLYC